MGTLILKMFQYCRPGSVENGNFFLERPSSRYRVFQTSKTIGQLNFC